MLWRWDVRVGRSWASFKEKGRRCFVTSSLGIRNSPDAWAVLSLCQLVVQDVWSRRLCEAFAADIRIHVSASLEIIQGLDFQGHGRPSAFAQTGSFISSSPACFRWPRGSGLVLTPDWFWKVDCELSQPQLLVVVSGSSRRLLLLLISSAFMRGSAR